MSPLLLMEWSMKPPYDWNRELSIFNSEETKSFSHLEPMEWYNQRDPEFGFGSLDLAGDGRGYDSPVSDLVNSSSSKSIKSASISLIEECKNSKITTDDLEVFLEEDCGERKEMVQNGSAGTSSALETSAGSSEQHFLSLKLGKAMYYEDSCSEKAVATLCMMPPTRQNRAKRCKSTHKSTLTLRCQVEGCNIDLSSAKEYHRKHRVCESHSRSPNVIVAGFERRFCQQCSRFHGLSDFDEKKRSCRKRLSDHNARRRKSLPKVTNFNSGSPSSVYDPRQQMSLSLDMVPPTYQRPAANLAWEALCSSKYTQTCQRKPEKAICKNGQLNPLGIEKPFMITIPHRTSSKLFATRGIAADDLNPGFNEYGVSPSMDVARDYNSALSLLSTDAWGLCESKNILPQNHKQPNQIKMSSTGIQTTSQSSSLPSDQWRDEHNSSASGFHILQQQGDGGTDFQLFKPLENGLYPDLLG